VIRIGRGRLLLCSALCALLCCGIVAAAPADDLYQPDAIKAAFLYRFTGYVDWPPQSLNGSAFTIAVLDADAVAARLARIVAAHPIKDRPANVISLHRAGEAAAAQMLYIGSSYPGNLRAAVRAVGARPILVVTDREGALDQGSVVNFLVVDRHVRFEVSLPAAARAGLKIEPALLSVAVDVRGAPH
jgi:hypothetical protein